MILRDIPAYGFNSTLVLLEVANESVLVNLELTFQFHAGSIRRTGTGLGFPARDMFQFHAGSIRSTLSNIDLFHPKYVSIPRWFY